MQSPRFVGAFPAIASNSERLTAPVSGTLDSLAQSNAEPGNPVGPWNGNLMSTLKQPLVGLLDLTCNQYQMIAGAMVYLSSSVVNPNLSARVFHSEQTGQDLLYIHLLTRRCSLNIFRLGRYLYNDVKVPWDRINIFAFVQVWGLLLLYADICQHSQQKSHSVVVVRICQNHVVDSSLPPNLILWCITLRLPLLAAA